MILHQLQGIGCDRGAGNGFNASKRRHTINYNEVTVATFNVLMRTNLIAINDQNEERSLDWEFVTQLRDATC